MLFVARGTAKAWLDAVEDDFIWLRTVSSKCSELATPSSWWRSFRENPISMKKLVAEVCKSKPANQLNVCARSVAEHAIGQPFPCQLCNKVFGSRQALAVHSFKSHNVVRKARYFVDSSAVCYACLWCFSSRCRCIEHLTEKSPMCLQQLASTFTPLADSLVIELDMHDRKLARYANKKALTRRAGAVSLCVIFKSRCN